MGDIPKDNHITRYIDKVNVYQNGDLDPGAFRLRKLKRGPEKSVSVNWVEHQNADRAIAISQIQKIYKQKVRNYTPDSVTALFNVGECIDNVHLNSPDRRMLRILHTPGNDPRNSHSSITGIKFGNDDLVLELICDTLMCSYDNAGV